MRCVYCLDNGELRDEQILVRGTDLYLCAPRGQMVEGYLAIAPYDCVDSVAQMPPAWIAELRHLQDLVSAFYRRAYRTERPTFYEQARVDATTAGFPLHAHVCCLPVAVEVDRVLGPAFDRQRVACLSELAGVVGDDPYVYVDGPGGRVVYLPVDDHTRSELVGMRLKPTIAGLLGMPERGYWRDYPGDAELARVIERFAA